MGIIQPAECEQVNCEAMVGVIQPAECEQVNCEVGIIRPECEQYYAHHGLTVHMLTLRLL